MYTCKYCQRETSTHKSNWIHQSRCPSNPDRFKQEPWNKNKKGVQKSWNKGRTDLTGHPHTEETKKRLSESAKKRNLGGYNPGSGRGKKGWYKGVHCDSSWELAYLIYCLDHDISIKRNTEIRTYFWKSKTKKYIPDFIVNGQVVEIKGYVTEEWQAKMDANPDVKIYYGKDLAHVFQYVHAKYGKKFISLYEEGQSDGRLKRT